MLPLRLYFFASFAALGLYSPFFPRWLAARGIEGVAMGATVAVIPVMGVVGPPLVGLLADSIGLRGSLLRVACLGSFGAFALLAAAGLAGRPLGFSGILAAVLIFAAFRAPMLTMADVVAMEREHDGGASYGRTRLWGSVGFLAATVGGGRYVDPESAAALPAAVAASLLLALLATVAVPVKSGAVRLGFAENVRALAAAGEAGERCLLLAAVFVAELAISSHEICFSIYLADLGASSAFIGLAWALGVGAEILMMAGAAPLIARFGAPSLMVAALCGAAIRCALLSTLRSLPALMAIQVLHAPSVALFWVSALSHLKRRTSARSFATVQGIFSAVTAAGTVAGMLAWSALYHCLGGRGTFGAAAVVAASAVLLALYWAARAEDRRAGEGRSPAPSSATTRTGP